MKYDLFATGKRSFAGINVEYKGETLFFTGSQKVNGGNADEELFKFINQYLNNLDESILDKHWELLRNAKRILEPGYFDEKETDFIKELRLNTLNYEYLIEKLEPVINEIYVNITPDKIIYAADVLGFTNPPKDLNAMTRQGDYPEETTIDGYKYKELAKLTFVTQLAFPIFNQFLGHILPVTGKEYKDAVVGKLVDHITAIKDLSGYQILNTYLRASCLRQEGMRNSIEVGSDVRYIDHIVYKGLFNKLCLTFLPSLVKGKNLSNELNSLVAGEVRLNNDVKFKSFGDPKPNGDDLSIAESYTISQEINGTDELAKATFFNYTIWKESVRYNENGVPEPLLERNYSDFFVTQALALGINDYRTAEKIFNAFPQNKIIILTIVHTTLLQLAFQGKVNYLLYPALNYEQLIAALSLAQVKLFEMGFENLACCCFITRDETSPAIFLEDSYRLNTKEREFLVSICGDYVGQNDVATENSAVVAFTEFLDILGACGWTTNIELGLLGNEKYVDKMSGGHEYELEITSDIKRELLELVKLRTTIEVSK